MEEPLHNGESWKGKTLNNITVIGVFSGHGKNTRGKRVHTKWLLECSCGNIFHTAKSNVIKGMQHSCILCREKYKRDIDKSLWRGTGIIPKTYISRVIAGAEARGLSYNLSDEYIWKVLESQEFKCALSGIEIGFSGSKIDRSTGWSASLDRINSSMPYEEGNVQWVHKDLNRMKSNLEEAKFLDYCRLVSEYSNNN